MKQSERLSFVVGELQDHSKTLLYEFEALYETAAGYKVLANSGERSNTNRWQMNAHVEAFAIHCRSLQAFFFEKPFPTDVIATDFGVPDFSASPSAPIGVVRARLKQAATQANKQIAHITVERRGLNQTPAKMADWDMGQCLLDLCHVIGLFLDVVSEQNLAPGVREHLQELIDRSHHLCSSHGKAGSFRLEVSSPPTSGGTIYPGLQAKTEPTKLAPSQPTKM